MKKHHWRTVSDLCDPQLFVGASLDLSSAFEWPLLCCTDDQWEHLGLQDFGALMYFCCFLPLFALFSEWFCAAILGF